MIASRAFLMRYHTEMKSSPLPLAFFLPLLLFAVLPTWAQARDYQANTQCPPGGVKGQPCKDNTNGYITNGHCSYVNVCTADSWNENAPKGCGNGGSDADCPKGSTPSYNSAPALYLPASTATSPFTIASDIIYSAYATVSADAAAPIRQKDPYAGRFLTPEEMPGAGEPLQPPPAEGPPAQDFSALRDAASGLSASDASSSGAEGTGTGLQGFSHDSSSFGGASQSGDLARSASGGGLSDIGTIGVLIAALIASAGTGLYVWRFRLDSFAPGAGTQSGAGEKERG